MKKYVSRALWCALLAGGLTVLGATAANAAESGGEDGLVSGNQVLSSITAPVIVEGNAISLLGDSSSSGTSTGPAVVSDSGDSDSAVTDGEDGVASGNQVSPDVTAPVAVEGNAISLLGDSSSSGTSTGPAVVTDGTDSDSAVTDGEDGVASGNQVSPDVTAPVAVEGNAISLLGDSSSSGISTGPAAVTGNDDEGILESGNDDERVLRLGFASEVGAVVDGNIADERVDDNAKEGRTNAAVIQGTSAGSADGELETLALNEPVAAEGDLSTQALAATGADAGNGATAAALMLGAGLTLTTVARRKSLRL
jgi:hypothetical protein